MQNVNGCGPTGGRRIWRFRALVAALFGWHPLMWESVAWVAEREGCPEHIFFLLHAAGLRELCKDAGSKKHGATNP